jgi:hypothetical protein
LEIEMHVCKERGDKGGKNLEEAVGFRPLRFASLFMLDE